MVNGILLSWKKQENVEDTKNQSEMCFFKRFRLIMAVPYLTSGHAFSFVYDASDNLGNTENRKTSLEKAEN